MQSKIFSMKNKKSLTFYLVRVLLGIAVVIVLAFLVLYLSVPSYRFEDPVAFHGNFIRNPYNTEKNDWHYYDFRSDTIDEQGFDVSEYGYGLSKARYLCIGGKDKRKIDYPFFQNIHYKQFNIDELQKKHRFAVPILDKGFKKREMRNLSHYRLLEVFNTDCQAVDYWDEALSHGNRVNVLASCGNINKEVKYVTVVNAKDVDSVYAALESGDSYAVAYQGNIEDLPELKSVRLDGDTMTVQVSEKAAVIHFIGQNGVVKDSILNNETASYRFADDDTYIRTEVVFDDATVMYLNALVRHPYQYYFDPNMATVMKGRTMLMRVVYIIAFVAFGRYLLTRRKDDADGAER